VEVVAALDWVRKVLVGLVEQVPDSYYPDRLRR
jgi:hypothetical protein